MTRDPQEPPTLDQLTCDPTADAIGLALRKIHAGVVSEPIPEAFLILLAELDSYRPRSGLRK